MSLGARIGGGVLTGTLSQPEQGWLLSPRPGCERCLHPLPSTVLLSLAEQRYWLSSAPAPSALRSGRCHHRLALAGPDRHEARSVEGQLEGLARAVANEAHLGVALDLRLQVRRPADRRLRVNEGRLLRAVQEYQRPLREQSRLIFW